MVIVEMDFPGLQNKEASADSSDEDSSEEEEDEEEDSGDEEKTSDEVDENFRKQLMNVLQAGNALVGDARPAR